MNLLPRDDPRVPKYWRDETGGMLAVAIDRLLNDQGLYPSDVALIVAYFKQWIDSPVWDMNPHMDHAGRQVLAGLRQRIADMQARRESLTRVELVQWSEDALYEGMDPL
jgi:hypothetical protein